MVMAHIERIITRNWHALTDKVRERWDALTEAVLVGERRQVIARFREWGLSTEEAEKKVVECTCWQRTPVKLLRIGNNFCDCAPRDYDADR